LNSSRSDVVRPGRFPPSRSAWRTHRRGASVGQPLSRNRPSEKPGTIHTSPSGRPADRNVASAARSTDPAVALCEGANVNVTS
jgi:hypothetical protein